MDRSQISIEDDPIEGDPNRKTLHIGDARNVLTFRTMYQGRPAPAVIFNLCGPFHVMHMPAIAEALLEYSALADRLAHQPVKRGKTNEIATAGKGSRRNRPEQKNVPHPKRRR